VRRKASKESCPVGLTKDCDKGLQTPIVGLDRLEVYHGWRLLSSASEDGIVVMQRGQGILIRNKHLGSTTGISREFETYELP
jgi:hypothetical protein